jgi:DNA-binding XRE family transcriptional regulator
MTATNRLPRRWAATTLGLRIGAPKPVALLDLSKPGERRVERFMRWAVADPQRLWSPLAVARREKVLLLAVEWQAWPHSHDEPFGLVELSLCGTELRWRSFLRRQRDRMMALIADGESAEHLSQRFGDMLADRRESAGLTRMELATAAKLSYQTICNVETGRNIPSLQTMACLRQVAALGLCDGPLMPSRSRSR